MSSGNEIDIEKQAERTYSHTNDDTLRANDVARVEPGIHHDGRETILIGNTKVYKDELVRAFGGTAQPGLAAPATHKFANAAPLGLSAFALTTFVLSMFNARAMGIEVPNVVASLAFFYGGAVQVLAGMWEFASENTFAACAFSSYGGFWISYAALITDAFGISAAYQKEGAEDQMASAIGFFLLGWTIFTILLWMCTIRSTWAFSSLFFFLWITFLLLSIGEFTGSVGATRAGGVIGVIVAFIAWYNAYAGLATKENTYVTIRPVYLPGSTSRL